MKNNQYLQIQMRTVIHTRATCIDKKKSHVKIITSQQIYGG